MSIEAVQDEQANAVPEQPVVAAAPPKIDRSNLVSTYTNIARATGTPEEVLLDFGLNSQSGPMSEMPVEYTQRIIMNFYTAKRLAGLLNAIVVRHEEAFGVLEIDVNKRVRSRSK